MYEYIVWNLLQPYALLMLALGVGIVLLWRRRTETRRRLLLATSAYLLLLVFSFPAVSYLLRGSLEWRSTALRERPEDVDAIVVLSSTVRHPDGERKGEELDEDGMDRCLRTAELYRQGRPCRVLVSGGNVNGAPHHKACAAVMRDFLVQLGVRPEDVIVEGQSRSTHENAIESARILKEQGLKRMVLVTDATHLPRAEACFRKQGVDVVPCGCGYRATPHANDRFRFVPSLYAALGSQRAFHEWLGLAWYWVRGRI